MILICHSFILISGCNFGKLGVKDDKKDGEIFDTNVDTY